MTRLRPPGGAPYLAVGPAALRVPPVACGVAGLLSAWEVLIMKAVRSRLVAWWRRRRRNGPVVGVRAVARVVPGWAVEPTRVSPLVVGAPLLTVGQRFRAAGGRWSR